MPTPCTPEVSERPLRAGALLAAAIGLALQVQPAAAQEDNAWELSGFGTVGMVSQHGAEGWRLSRNMTQASADGPVSGHPDSRLGLQANWRDGSQWEGTVQVVAMPRPERSPLRDSLEWAYVGYRPLANTRLRIGRTNPDTFLYADSRNVGYALPWMRPPVDFYGFAPVAAIDGLDVEHQWSQDDTRWRARVTAGRFASMASLGDGGSFRVRASDAWAASLLREQGGLLLKASALRTQLKLDMPESFMQLKQAVGGLQALPVPGLSDALNPIQDALWTDARATYLAMGAQYDHGPWSLVTEASDLRIPKTQTGGQRAYASVSYRIGSVSTYTLISRVRPHHPVPGTPDLVSRLAPVMGDQAAMQAQGLAEVANQVGARSRFDQRTVGVGLRWDVSPQVAFKFQWDHFKVYPQGSAAWIHGSNSPNQGHLVSAGLDFVWGP